VKAPEKDFVRLSVAYGPGNARGEVLDTWQEYSFENDIFTPCDSFSFRVGLTSRRGLKAMGKYEISDLRYITAPDTVVRLELGEDHDLAAIGIIDDQFEHGDRTGNWLDLSGRDGMSILQDNDCQMANARISNTTLPELAARIVEPYRGKGIPYGVYADNNSNRDLLTGHKKPLKSRFGEVKPKQIRTSAGVISIFGAGALGKNDVPIDFVKLPIEEARPHPGENEYKFLDRHAANLGVMMMMSADGNLIFFRPDYNQPVTFELRRYLRNKTAQNNILSGGVRRNTANTATRVKMLGHTSGKAGAKTQVTAVAEMETSYVFPRTKVIRDGHAKDKSRAQKEANRALARANTNLTTLEYTMQGHAQDGLIYAPDTIAHVVDELCDIDGIYYITARSIRKSRGETLTTLKLVQRGAIVLDYL
jgi:prophage tail gpP-like protein